jgi:hypothetical protein
MNVCGSQLSPAHGPADQLYNNEGGPIFSYLSHCLAEHFKAIHTSEIAASVLTGEPQFIKPGLDLPFLSGQISLMYFISNNGLVGGGGWTPLVLPSADGFLSDGSLNLVL